MHYLKIAQYSMFHSQEQYIQTGEKYVNWSVLLGVLEFQFGDWERQTWEKSDDGKERHPRKLNTIACRNNEAVAHGNFSLKWVLADGVGAEIWPRASGTNAAPVLCFCAKFHNTVNGH